jgi:type II secretory pathway pseudopilin PulG
MRHKKRPDSGVSLTEVLLVMTIIGLLIIVVLSFLMRYLGRARDAERKADLQEIKISFEDYFNDNGCYPDPSVLNDCNGTSFRPYLSTIPCDPATNESYYYAPLADQCEGYRIYAKLEDDADPIIVELGCNTLMGCGPGITYNYGVSSGTAVFSDGVVAPSSSPGASPSSSPGSSSPGPSPSGIIYEYACDSAGTCNRYEQGHPFLISCPVTFEQSNCENACGNVANRCNG